MADLARVKEAIAHCLAGGDGMDGKASDWDEVADELIDALDLLQVGWWDTKYQRLRRLNEPPTIDAAREPVYLIRGRADA